VPINKVITRPNRTLSLFTDGCYILTEGLKWIKIASWPAAGD